jgi:hypothetical protein
VPVMPPLGFLVIALLVVFAVYLLTWEARG